jgi:hypothetical protein
MLNDISALAKVPGKPDDGDYQSLYAALSESARGRDFLAEFARRNRNADTELLLAALDRLEAKMHADGTALERLRDELRVLLIAIRLARPDIAAANPTEQATQLASLLDILERRIDALAEGKTDKVWTVAEPEPALAILTVVPLSDEPELPIPSPSAAQPAIALVRETAMPAVTFIPGVPLGPPVIEAVTPAPIALPVVIVAAVPPQKTAASLPPVDPLAAIMALSEAERIALFT